LVRGPDRPTRLPSRQRALEDDVADDHALRAIREVVDDVLLEFSPELAKIYSHRGRPSVPPEKILRALVLQVVYGVASEGLLLTLLNERRSFRWFVGLRPRDRVWHATTVTKNRPRLRKNALAQRFLRRVLEEGERRRLFAGAEFAVDETLLDAWGRAD
jgi:transposase